MCPSVLHLEARHSRRVGCRAVRRCPRRDGVIMAQKIWALGAAAGLMLLAACSATTSPAAAPKASASVSTRHPAGPPSGVLKVLEASRHVDVAERVRCANADNGMLRTAPILATSTTTFGAVKTAMNAQFGPSSTRHLPFAAQESVVLCLFKPFPLPTPRPTTEPNISLGVLAVGADGSTWIAGGQAVP